MGLIVIVNLVVQHGWWLMMVCESDQDQKKLVITTQKSWLDLPRWVWLVAEVRLQSRITAPTVGPSCYRAMVPKHPQFPKCGCLRDYICVLYQIGCNAVQLMPAMILKSRATNSKHPSRCCSLQSNVIKTSWTFVTNDPKLSTMISHVSFTCHHS